MSDEELENLRHNPAIVRNRLKINMARKNARVFIDIQNTGMAPLASLKQTEIALVSGSAEDYDVSAGVFNVLDAVVRVSSGAGNTDLPMSRLSYEEWLEIPTKETSKGRPTHYFVNRQRDNVKLNFWPVPTTTQYTFKAWTLNKIADVDRSYQLVDLPTRYLPTLIKGLRYYMGYLRGKSPMDEVAALKKEFLDALDLATSEDRERVSYEVHPTGRRQLGS